MTSLNAHIKRMHEDLESKIHCGLCPFVTKELRGLEDHRKNIHMF